MKICAPQSEFHDEVIAQVVQAQLSVVLFSIGFVSADCRISRKRGSQGGREEGGAAEGKHDIDLRRKGGGDGVGRHAYFGAKQSSSSNTNTDFSVAFRLELPLTFKEGLLTITRSVFLRLSPS